MTNPLIRIWIHAFFGTKKFIPLIKNSFKDELEDRIKTKIQTEYKSYVKNIKALDNHLHFLFMLNPVYALSDIQKNIKGESSHWINGKKFIDVKFAWQKSFFGLSVSESQLDAVDKFISNQESFHKKYTFREEIQMLLSKLKLPNRLSRF